MSAQHTARPQPPPPSPPQSGGVYVPDYAATERAVFWREVRVIATGTAIGGAALIIGTLGGVGALWGLLS